MVWFNNLQSHETQAKTATVGYPVAWDWIADNIKRAQDYLLQNTTLGIPALVQTEGMYKADVNHVKELSTDCVSQGIHGFLVGNATIFNSPIAYGCSWNKEVGRLSPSANNSKH